MASVMAHAGDFDVMNLAMQVSEDSLCHLVCQLQASVMAIRFV